MKMAVIHMSEPEAAQDFGALLASAPEPKSSSKTTYPYPLCCGLLPSHVAALSESLRLTKEHGSTITLDGGFALDLETVVDSHPEPLTTAWN